MEKTFEELIIERFSAFGLIKANFSRNEVISMMHQVREATKAECLEIVDKGYYWPSASKKIELIPTDRIKLTAK